MSPSNQAPSVKVEVALAKKSRAVSGITGVNGNTQTPVSSSAPSGPAALPEAAGVGPAGLGSVPAAPDVPPAGPGVEAAAPGALPEAMGMVPIGRAEPGVVPGTELSGVTGMVRRTTHVPVPPPADDEDGPEEDYFPPSPPHDSDSN